MHLKPEEGIRKTKGDIYRIIPPKMSNMDYIAMTEKARKELSQIVNQRWDAITWMHQKGEHKYEEKEND